MLMSKLSLLITYIARFENFKLLEAAEFVRVQNRADGHSRVFLRAVGVVVDDRLRRLSAGSLSAPAGRYNSVSIVCHTFAKRYCAISMEMLLATVLLLVLHCITADIPPYIKVCQRNDPNVDKCIMNSVEELRPKMIDGIPELDVPGIEPLSLGQIALARGPQGAKLTAVVNDVKVNGPSNFVIEELKSDLDNNRFDFKLLLPKLDFNGKYKMDIQVLLLRLQGRGNITGTFRDYACNVTMRGHKEKRGDEEYLRFDPFKVKLRVGQSSIYLTNLFDGDPVLGPATNRVINENSNVFLEEIRPVLERSLGELFTEMANKITAKFTYKELFP